MVVVIVQTASRMNPLLQYQNIQLKSIIDMAAEQDKVLISDEITEKIISSSKFYIHKGHDETCDYPFIALENGERFYFNRFVFL